MYVPIQWLNDKNNEKEVHKILDNVSDVRTNTVDKEIEERLKKIGENRLAKKWYSGEL